MIMVLDYIMQRMKYSKRQEKRCFDFAEMLDRVGLFNSFFECF